MAEFKKNFLFYRLKLVSKIPKPDPDQLAYQTAKKLFSDLRIDSHVFDWHTSVDESKPDTFILYITYSHGIEQLDSYLTPTSTKLDLDPIALLRAVVISFKSVETRLPYDIYPFIGSIAAIETCADPICSNVTSIATSRTNSPATGKPMTKSYVNAASYQTGLSTVLLINLTVLNWVIS